MIAPAVGLPPNPALHPTAADAIGGRPRGRS